MNLEIKIIRFKIFIGEITMILLYITYRTRGGRNGGLKGWSVLKVMMPDDKGM